MEEKGTADHAICPIPVVAFALEDRGLVKCINILSLHRSTENFELTVHGLDSGGLMF